MKLFNILILAAMLSLGTGCVLFRNPDKSWDKATAKQVAVENKIQKNENKQLQEGRNYVYATKLALEADPNTNQFHAIETKLNDKAGVVLGPPTMEDENALRVMVANLLSTNQSLIAKGEKQLAERDARVIDLQQENAALRGKLEKAEAKVIEVGTTNAAYASSWTTLMKFVWGAIYLVIGVFVIKLLAVVLPPPYNSIVGLIAVPIGIITKALHAFVPEAKKTAGVVASQVYDNTKLTLEHIITAFEEAKTRKPDVMKELSPFLKEETSSEISRPLITDIKRELGYT